MFSEYMVLCVFVVFLLVCAQRHVFVIKRLERKTCEETRVSFCAGPRLYFVNSGQTFVFLKIAARGGMLFCLWSVLVSGLEREHRRGGNGSAGTSLGRGKTEDVCLDRAGARRSDKKSTSDPTSVTSRHAAGGFKLSDIATRKFVSASLMGYLGRKGGRSAGDWSKY